MPHASAEDLSKHAAGVAAIKARGGTMANSWKNSSDLAGANDVSAQGRWPANVVLDEDAGRELDEQSGVRPSTLTGKASADCSHSTPADPSRKRNNMFGNKSALSNVYADTGGASRFFYCAKASRADRGEGNTHNTVKPTSLMRWLVRLVTPPGGLVLDPFTGSGSTGVAAITEGFRFAGIELSDEYACIARARIARSVTP